MSYLLSLIIFVVVAVIAYEFAPTKSKIFKLKNKNIIKSFIDKIAGLNSGLRFENYRNRITKELVRVQPFFISDSDEFFAIKEISAVIVFMIFVLVFGNFVFAVLLGSAGFFAPDLWLREKTEKFRRKIVKELPYFLDMLILVVEAGLDVVAGINKIVQKSKQSPLIEELKRALEEIRIGKTREEALDNLSKRLDIQEISSFTYTLTQSFNYGAGVSGLLRAQSEKISLERFMRAEKTANQASVKMLFPMVLFIFPVVFIMLFGPVVLQLIK